MRGKQFALVEDVVSSGGAIVDALGKLKADGLLPVAAICVIDRQSGGSEALAQHELPLRSLFTLEEIERA